MEERYNIYSEGRTGWTIFRNHEEFQEEDVWDVFSNQNDSNSKKKSFDSSTIAPRKHPSAARMIPKANKNSNQEPKLVQQSVPVNIPDWPKIYGTNLKNVSRNDSEKGDNMKISDSYWCSDEDDDDELDGEMIPPHEWIAKKLARARISSFSVCEGVGRTLKGRDLSRVRNAVLTRTGFLE